MLDSMTGVQFSEWCAYYNLKYRREEMARDDSAEKAKARAKANNF
jgi:hypothetical protein